MKVWPGDCNEQIDAALAELAEANLRWAQTFAFVDQYAAEIRWTTLEKLAAYKQRSRFKVEMWLLFAHSNCRARWLVTPRQLWPLRRPDRRDVWVS